MSTSPLYISHMKEAVIEARKALARGDRPIGAVIVHKERVIARASDTTFSENSNINHAALKAVLSIKGFLADYGTECMLFTTSEPCAMCLCAILNSNIQHIISGRKKRQGEDGDIFKKLKTMTSSFGEKECNELYENYLANSKPDGFPLPPPHLMFLVSSSHDATWFLEGGRGALADINETLALANLNVNSFTSILDFGCGSGRVIRHLRPNGQTLLSGTDYNPALINWCQNNLTHASFAINGLEPPTGYQTGSFDFIYAFSILTHWPEELQLRWINEFARILRPGGCMLFTTHGRQTAERGLSGEQLNEFNEGKFVVLNSEISGANDCAAFHPESYVRKVFSSSFEILKFIESGSKGTPGQDLYLVRRKS